MQYRVEQKFIIAQSQMSILQSRLYDFMEKDHNQTGNGYGIRSLYFDDYNDNCTKENEAGIGQREKLRIRIYNGDTDFIRLEQKSKYNSYTQKESAVISKQDCIQCMNGEIPVIDENSPFLLKKLYVKMQSQYLHPVTIVEYERSAYIGRLGNVRITFDQNICACSDINSFMDHDIYGVPLFEKGFHILEVKYDEFLPDYLRDILCMCSLQQSSFSKYYYARNNVMLY